MTEATTTARAWPAPLWRMAAAVGLAAGITGIFILSAQSSLPHLPFTFIGFDKLEHALAFGLLGVLACLVIGLRGSPDKPRVWSIIAAIAFIALYAALDEWHQSFVPGRDCSVFDALADVAGATLAIALLLHHRRLAARRRGDGKGFARLESSVPPREDGS